ncbi:MAG: amino acid ABC transporter ATP-binding protein [Peptococcaceae bacterium]|jgi:L-cystine transport system ATP-binding protein|nr:amino acid ABC transporter ATP-binding protein [Peptococcaceae bacterium]
MIEIKNLSKSFGSHHVIRDISLTINDKEVVALIGPSGTGKTTLLRCINFLTCGDKGEISMGGLTVDCRKHSRYNLLNLRRKSAMVFQNYNLFQNKTALQNITEGLIYAKGLKKPEAEKRACVELEKVGLADRAYDYPHRLSGGQQQRVAIARAMALDPEVILFDEPTSALDPEKVGEVLLAIKRVAREGITMIIVTHELDFARNVASRILFMDEGIILEDGAPDEVFQTPKNERTKRFMQNYNNDFIYNI